MKKSVARIVARVLLPVLLCSAMGCDQLARTVAFRDGGFEHDTSTTIDAGKGTDTGSDTTTGHSGEPGCISMDILFVIDNSASMIQEQEDLSDKFSKLVEVLDSYETPLGTQLLYRVAVTTTAVERDYMEKFPYFPPAPVPVTGTTQDGLLVGKEKCGLDNPWVESTDEERNDKFACLADVGTKGFHMEMPFAALELALGDKSGPGQPNEGFYRKGTNSLLVVVIITDEDDCSVVDDGLIVHDSLDGVVCGEKSEGVYDVEERTKMFLDDISDGPGRYVVVGVAGQGPDQCDSGLGAALWGKRIQELISLLGSNGTFGDICKGDVWKALEKGLEVMQVSCDGLPVV
jgi:hypothetical protein